MNVNEARDGRIGGPIRICVRRGLVQRGDQSRSGGKISVGDVRSSVGKRVVHFSTELGHRQARKPGCLRFIDAKHAQSEDG